MHEDGKKCTECAERGVECLSQEARPLKQPRVESKQGLQERIVKLESLVESLVDRLDDDRGSTKEVRLFCLVPIIEPYGMLHDLHLLLM